jgi:hypothetical protein
MSKPRDFWIADLGKECWPLVSRKPFETKTTIGQFGEQLFVKDITTNDWLRVERITHASEVLPDQQDEIDQLNRRLTPKEVTEALIMLDKENRAELTRLRVENEQLRVQLAGCGVAALGNTIEAVKQRVSKGDYGWSASYGDVCDAVDRELKLREALSVARDSLIEAKIVGSIAEELENPEVDISDVAQFTNEILASRSSVRNALARIDAIMSQKSENCDTSAEPVAADDTKGDV